jgi:hypothetical protein
MHYWRVDEQEVKAELLFLAKPKFESLGCICCGLLFATRNLECWVLVGDVWVVFVVGEIILVVKPGHFRVRTISEGLSNQPVPSSLNWAGFV